MPRDFNSLHISDPIVISRKISLLVDYKRQLTNTAYDLSDINIRLSTHWDGSNQAAAAKKLQKIQDDLNTEIHNLDQLISFLEEKLSLLNQISY